MERTRLAELAQRQLDDYDRHRPGLLFAEDGAATLTLAEAYELQLRVAALRQARGETLAGFKIGCVSETVRKQLGLAHPVFGHVFSTELHSSGCVLDPARYDGLAIEGEFAVRLGEEQRIVSVFPVIELHNYVFRGAAQTARELVGNNAIHAGVVLPGEEPALADLESLRGEPLVVCINGEERGTADGSALPETILANLRSVREHLDEFGIHLRPGQIVLTGSPLPLYRVQAGDRIDVRCPRLPPVSARLQ